jgi:hypothetical protein
MLNTRDDTEEICSFLIPHKFFILDTQIAAKHRENDKENYVLLFFTQNKSNLAKKAKKFLFFCGNEEEITFFGKIVVFSNVI